MRCSTSGHQYTPDFPLTLYTADLPENGQKSVMIFSDRDTQNLPTVAFSQSRALLRVGGRSDVLGMFIGLKNKGRTSLPGPFVLKPSFTNSINFARS